MRTNSKYTYKRVLILAKLINNNYIKYILHKKKKNIYIYIYIFIQFEFIIYFQYISLKIVKQLLILTIF